VYRSFYSMRITGVKEAAGSKDKGLKAANS
jgi:hypothetical protein